MQIGETEFEDLPYTGVSVVCQGRYKVSVAGVAGRCGRLHTQTVLDGCIDSKDFEYVAYPLSYFEHYSNAAEIEPEKIANNAMDEELLRKAIAIVEKNMSNVEFSTEQFASEMNMSRSNLHLKLKAITGKSAIDFIHKIRFNRACQLLKEGKYTVSEISFMVGYNTPSYFSARFKKYIGCLPTEYGKQ